MTESIDWVNELLVGMNKYADQIKETNPSAHKKTVNKINAIEDLRAENARLKIQLQPLSVDLGDLSDLPIELLSELPSSKQSTLDTQIVQVIDSYGGQADITQILVGLYRKFEVVQKRKYMQNKIWRLSKKDLVWSVKGAKGLYTTTKPQKEPETLPEPTNDDDFLNGNSSETFDRDLDDEIPF